jgi:hypothetical protein
MSYFFMRRASHAIADFANYLDSLSGKCHTVHESEEFNDACYANPLLYIADVALVNADIFLTGIAKEIESLVAKPICFAEKLITRKPNPPAWTFS